MRMALMILLTARGRKVLVLTGKCSQHALMRQARAAWDLIEALRRQGPRMLARWAACCALIHVRAEHMPHGLLIKILGCWRVILLR